MQEKLNNFVSFYSGLTYSPADVTSSKDGVLVLRSSNIENDKMIFTDNIFVKKSKVNSKYVEKNDLIVVVRNGSRPLLGKHALVEDHLENTVIGAFMTGIQSQSPHFVNNLLSTVAFKREIHKNLGATINQITNKNFRDMKFFIPNLEEANKIGELLKKLNHIITLEQEKVKKIEQLKESFLQNLFPKKDHYIPELRIQGFSKDWETIKLGSILSKGNRKKVDNPNNYNRLTVKLHKRGLEKFIPDRHMANTRPFYQRFSGELIIGKQNYFNGSLAIVSDEFDGYISSNAIMSFSILRADINFLYNYIGRDSYINERAYLANGTGQKELSEKDFLNFKIKAPSLLEQKEIGKLFKQFNNIIDESQEKINLYLKIKEMLLNNLFI